MYKILQIIRKSATQPLWAFVTEVKDVDDGTGTLVSKTVEFETDDLDVLEDKLISLMATMGSENFRVIQDVTYEIDILVNP